MKNIILFDQDSQHYRQSIYLAFKEEFKKLDYNLIVAYDKKLNTINNDTGFFVGIDYAFFSFIEIMKQYNCKLIIQFVWLRYRFILPLMLFNRLRGIKTIVWSHGINLQNKKRSIKNLFYYLRQLLANALIIYTPDQKQYIKASHKKLFIANNTLAFQALPKISLSRDELKEKYRCVNKKVLISIGRFNVNNRKVGHLIGLAKLLNNEFYIILIGSGVSDKEIKEIEKLDNIDYKGIILDQEIICELYKMADVFIMPGAIGLAINQAQFFETPVIVERVNQGPEGYYLEDGVNGLFYDENDIDDLKKKVITIFNPKNYIRFVKNAKSTCEEKGSFDNMINGFIKAIEYVENI